MEPSSTTPPKTLFSLTIKPFKLETKKDHIKIATKHSKSQLSPTSSFFKNLSRQKYYNKMTGKRSLMKLKKFVVKLTRCMQVLQQIRPISSEEESALVPEGHFAVLAANGEKRFVLELRYLKSPALLKLLKEAEEEYGFRQEGALVVPCSPEELQKVLKDM